MRGFRVESAQRASKANEVSSAACATPGPGTLHRSDVRYRDVPDLRMIRLARARSHVHRSNRAPIVAEGNGDPWKLARAQTTGSASLTLESWAAVVNRHAVLISCAVFDVPPAGDLDVVRIRYQIRRVCLVSRTGLRTGWEGEVSSRRSLLRTARACPPRRARCRCSPRSRTRVLVRRQQEGRLREHPSAVCAPRRRHRLQRRSAHGRTPVRGGHRLVGVDAPGRQEIAEVATPDDVLQAQLGALIEGVLQRGVGACTSVFLIFTSSYGSSALDFTLTYANGSSSTRPTTR